MAGDAAAVDGGLAEPVFGAQAIFRSIMVAFAEPGTLAEIGAFVSAPAPLAPAAAAFLAALADGDTPVWIEDPAGAGAAAARWLRFQTGAPIASDPGAAVFAVLSQGEAAATWDTFGRGSSDYPDRSATLLLPVRAFAGGSPIHLTGPGIEASRTIAPAGLPADFPAAMAANRAQFPLGFDLVLVCGDRALALPRTTRLQEG